MQIDVTTENLKFFQCFSSAKKLRIMELLKEGPKNIGELAGTLNVSSTIVTRHINEMSGAGIVRCDLSPGKRGLQKVCSLALQTATLDFTPKTNSKSETETFTINVGDYTTYQVEPTCGLAAPKQYIGVVDDPRYFSHPERYKAKLIWFQSGFLEYSIPSYVFDTNKVLESIQISMELGSEYPGFNNEYPSDIHFSMNNKSIGYWTSPGNFGDKKGIYTPEWFTCGSEYGLLKHIIINNKGTLIDGKQISDTTIEALHINNKENLTFKIMSPTDTSNPGGVSLFGKGFGNYDQDITITLTYRG